MKKSVYLIISTLLLLSIISCETYLDPQENNRLTEEQMLNDPVYFEGILLQAYSLLPAQYDFNADVISDDAVTNNKSSQYLRMATGEWRSTFYPNSQWENAYEAIYYINYFIRNYEKVTWSWESEAENEYHLQRLKGEAHALRAWWEFQLLQHHAGKSESGELLGFPIVTESTDTDDDFELPRNTFGACVDQIIADIDTAVKYLPKTYSDKDPSKPENLPYNAAMGSRFLNRLNGKAVQALKSRVTLYAASPAYAYLDWEDAAETSGKFLRSLGGGAAFVATGLEFYKDYESREILWSNSISSTNQLERQNYPPSNYGTGRTNPTQDLVDAFPMKNGYPISDPLSNYDPENPYIDKDPRLAKYIVFHGNVLKDTVYTDVSSNDGINKLETATRSGYYLKKFMLPSVNLVPGNITSAEHFYTYFRITEIFLNYAEAANEAWGPDADPRGYGFTPREVISLIRTRAGLPIFVFDNYLRSIADKESFREVIRNERRLELCFEGHRFWDIRRWNQSGTMSEPVHAMRIDLNADNPYSIEFLENRAYADYMIYGPIPYEEILKYDLVQNAGW